MVAVWRRNDSAHGRVLSIEEYAAGKDAFRVAANGIPIPLPVTQRRSDPQLEGLYEDVVKPQVLQTLSAYHVSYESSDLEYLYQPGNEAGGRETLIIFSRDQNVEIWPTVAKALLLLFRVAGFSGQMEVEIWNRVKMYWDISRVLPDDPALLAALEQAREGVLKVVDASLRGVCSSVAYHTRVTKRPADNVTPQEKPTIIIFCHPGSTCDFEDVEQQMSKILDAIPHQIHLEFLPGRIVPTLGGGGPRVQSRVLAKKPLNGSSIGIDETKNRAGTLGGWCMLNLPNGKRVPCAMTCYHVIRSDIDSVAAHTDANGIHWGDERGLVSVEYPAAHDIPVTMADLNEACAKTPKNYPCHEKREILSSLIPNPSIGKAILSSGHQFRYNRRMDWALVESPATFTPNKPPPHESFVNCHQCDSIYFQTPDSEVQNFGRAGSGDWVVKRGSTTGLTAGEINPMHRDVRWISGVGSQETEIITQRGPFADSGDSGSFVIDCHGDLVGMITGVESWALQCEIGFMTPIELIQEHVKEMTDGGFLSLN